MSEKLTIIGRLKAKPGKEAELRDALLHLVPLSRAEAGCLNYDLHEAIDEPGLFLLYENWTDQAALDLHFSLAHSKEFAANAPNLLAEPLHITVLREIS
ncbi:antibiotic biosynthesis monooxygenase [Oscillatoria sp. FACHB-1407]|uniref:putative quinol monooxygenase n=1 Tax=Oscillatoria sp. FACHB-1407 TaxID=2692847 RepID=UPI001686B8DF|nr:putative quinol monooxygenase [Oscillatoria sp. FACHB-1407]MBD2463533.1 antibiotic biosynthesis monooxygenase [Oscillatoria sp. FACHB-1407]